MQSVLLDRLPGAEKLAGLPGAKHAHLRAALRAHPELATYWTFGFVRNPWARLWSWWSMIERRQEMRDEGHAWATRRIENNPFWSGVLEGLPDFEAFVMEGPERFARLRTPQLRYLRTPERRADFIGRTETFGDDLAQVCDRLGIEPPPQEPRRNADPAGRQLPRPLHAGDAAAGGRAVRAGPARVRVRVLMAGSPAPGRDGRRQRHPGLVQRRRPLRDDRERGRARAAAAGRRRRHPRRRRRVHPPGRDPAAGRGGAGPGRAGDHRAGRGRRHGLGGHHAPRGRRGRARGRRPDRQRRVRWSRRPGDPARRGRLRTRRTSPCTGGRTPTT